MLAQEALIFSESSFIARMVCSTISASPSSAWWLASDAWCECIGGVAGDFLGGGTEFVDRRGDAVGTVGLLVGVGHRRVRGVHHQLRHVVQLTGGAGDLADRFVDTLDEAVEGNGQDPEFIVAGDLQALGQVAFALGDVLHGAAHVGERLHQYADQHAEEEDDGDHCDQRGDDRRGTRSLVSMAQALSLSTEMPMYQSRPDRPLDRRETEDLALPCSSASLKPLPIFGVLRG